MSTTPVLPHRVLLGPHVQASSWSCATRSAPEKWMTMGPGEVVPSWDQAQELVFKRSLQLVPEALESLGLGPEPQLVIVLSFATAHGYLRQPLARVPVRPGQPCDLRGAPDSRLLAKDLTLITTITLARPVIGAHDLLAPRSGHRLWSDSVRLILEGGSRPRLPMQVLPFGSRFPDLALALFHVEVAPFPELDFEQAVVVYLNSDFPAFVDAVRAESPMANALLWEGVVRRLIVLAVRDEGLLEAAADDATLGNTLRRWVALAFPDKTAKDIREMLLFQPSAFECAVQQFAGATPLLFKSAAGEQ